VRAPDLAGEIGVRPAAAYVAHTPRGARALRHAPALLLLLAYTVVVLFTFRDYGITFDEKWHADYGARILSWYRSGLTDRENLALPILHLGHADPNYANMSYYGGFFDATAELATRVSPLGRFETRHLVNALFGVAGAAFAYLLGLALAGRQAGFLAALFLILTPFYYGHAFANPKDIPFAVLYLASLYGIVRVVRRLPAPGWRLMAGAGVAIGLTMAVRFAGVLLLGYLALAFVAWALLRPRAEAVAGARRFAARFAGCAAVAFAAMLPWWPAALLSPLLHPLRTLRALGAFEWNYLVRFEGRDVPATELPWYYVSKYALLTLPEFVLMGLAAAMLLGVAAVVRRRARAERDLLPFGVVLLAALFPIAYAAITGATVYDAQRHFLFVFPPLVVLSAIGIAAMLRRSRPVAWLTAAATAAALLAVIVEMVRLHPYQYIYFNQVVAGGLPRAQASYETEYWGAAFKEAAEWASLHYAGTAEQPVRVAACGHGMSTAYYLPESTFRVVGPQGEPQLFLGSRRFGCWDTLDGDVVHTVARRGVPLVRIKEVGPVAAAMRRAGPADRSAAEVMH
jgi:hypothetical protein